MSINERMAMIMKTAMAVKSSLLAGFIASAMQLFALPNVTIDNVIQRWPWNNYVDITYTVKSGQDVPNGIYYALEFDVTVDGRSYVVSGSELGASTASGQHTVTWYNPPSGVKATTISVLASIVKSNVPAGDDYMIVDLETGDVTYEGLLASQDASNERYNKDLYKTEKMVLRKIAKGNTYQIGDDANYGDNSKHKDKNSAKSWTTDRDYYIGVFQVTCTQYGKLLTKSNWIHSKDYDGGKNRFLTRVAHGISYDDLRGVNKAPEAELGKNEEGTFLERLNAKTHLDGFDLPTEVMFEIAQRAGATTTYSWGSSLNTNYIVCTETVTNTVETSCHPMSVGMRLPNEWGLYDTSGNVWEWCRDDSGLANLKDALNPFVPAATGNTDRRMRGGGGHNSKALAGDNYQFHCSWRGTQPSNKNSDNRGFRVAWIRR